MPAKLAKNGREPQRRPHRMPPPQSPSPPTHTHTIFGPLNAKPHHYSQILLKCREKQIQEIGKELSDIHKMAQRQIYVLDGRVPRKRSGGGADGDGDGKNNININISRSSSIDIGSISDICAGDDDTSVGLRGNR